MGMGGTSYPEVGYKSKENEITIMEAERTGMETAGKPVGQICAQASSCTSKGWVEEALLPTELTLTEWSTTTGFSGLGLQFAKLE